MKPSDLIVRCYVERQEGVWIAACVDFCLAAQSRSRSEAIDKLHSQIKDHVIEAFANPERTERLLNRKAPIQYVAKFYWIVLQVKLKQALFHKTKSSAQAFSDCFPLKLA